LTTVVSYQTGRGLSSEEEGRDWGGRGLKIIMVGAVMGRAGREDEMGLMILEELEHIEIGGEFNVPVMIELLCSLDERFYRFQ
jgi:hypothetical protein